MGAWMRSQVSHELKDGIREIDSGADKGTKEEGYFHSIIKQNSKAIWLLNISNIRLQSEVIANYE